MLGCGSDHFRAEKMAGRDVTVYVEQAAVFEKNARAPLVFEAHLPRREAALLERLPAAANDRDLRIGEHDTQRSAAHAAAGCSARSDSCSVFTRNAPFIRSLVQERNEIARVARDEDRARA